MTARFLRDSWSFRPRRLDPPTESDYGRRVFECVTRKELDAVTREIWRFYGKGKSGEVNATALERLKQFILARRALLHRPTVFDSAAPLAAPPRAHSPAPA